MAAISSRRYAGSGGHLIDRKAWNSRIGVALLGIAAASANAHTGAGIGSGFVAGLRHPVSGLDHLLAMVGVGIWGTFLGRPLIWVLPVAFPLVMVVGGALGIANFRLLYVDEGIAASVLVLGLSIAFAWRAPTGCAIAIIAIFAVFHGYAHGIELPSAAAPEAYASGFVLCTGLLHLVGIAIGFLERMRGGVAALRVMGTVIATLGLWILVGEPVVV